MEGVKKQNIKIKLSVIFFLCFCLGAWIPLSGQSSYRIVGKSLFELKREQNMLAPIPLKKPLKLVDNSILKTNSVSFNANQSIPHRMVPTVYKYQDLAFFCRLEVKMEKAAKLPVRFRLGTVDYVDRLEGKY